MSSRSILSSLLTAAAAAFGLIGCATDPAIEPLIHTPKSGSGFNYVNYQKDTTGTTVQSSQSYSTRSIIATNVTLLGKGGVVQYVEDPDTSSIRYEANGDLSFLEPGITFPSAQFPAPPGVTIPTITIPPQWILFGFGSKSTQQIPKRDTTISVTFPGAPIPIPVQISVAGSTTYLSADQIAVGSEMIAAQKGLLTVTINLNTLIGNGTMTTTDTLWFAPKLGMFVKDESISSAVLPATFGRSGIQGGGSSLLTSYSMQ